MAGIAHTLYYNKQSRRFISRTRTDLWKSIFGTPVVETQQKDEEGTVTDRFVLPNDTAEMTTLHNTISVSLLENFRPWVKFGLSGYVRTENTWFSNADSLTGAYKDVDRYFSTFVGGYASRLTGRGLNFQAKGEIGVLGADLGAVHLQGNISSSFRLFGKEFGLVADAKLLNSRPPYFAKHHHGTFGWWDEDFEFTRHLELGGQVRLDSWGTSIEARTASLQNHLYWGADALLHQQKDVIQMSMLRAKHHYKLGPIGWKLEAAYQISSQPTAIPVPDLAAHADLYLDVLLFKVLRLQLGAEGYWHTAYYAPYYNPTHHRSLPRVCSRSPTRASRAQ